MTADDALRVAGSFGVDVRDAAAERLSGGYSNESWHVRGPSAAAVVRRYGRLHVSRAALAFEHAVAEHLAARIAEVAAPLRDGDGQTLLLDDGAYVAALPWIDGMTGLRDAASATIRSSHGSARATGDPAAAKRLKRATSHGTMPRKRVVRIPPAT